MSASGGSALECVQCGSDDVRGRPGRDDVITLTCEACGHTWERVPAQPCLRCRSGEVDSSGYEGWSYDDIDEARDQGHTTASWHYVDWQVLRCRKCHNEWRVSRGVSPPPGKTSDVAPPTGPRTPG